jgi:hypothetical protein
LDSGGLEFLFLEFASGVDGIGQCFAELSGPPSPTGQHIVMEESDRILDAGLFCCVKEALWTI